MPDPFVAYLRVYEPLCSFETPVRERLTKAIGLGCVDPTVVGALERRVWLRTQVAGPPRILPGEAPNGTAGDAYEVLVIDAADVTTGGPATVGPSPLVCPLDLRGRSAAALVGFLDDTEPPLRAAALTVPVETAKARANAVVSEFSDRAVHVLSSTWTVPLPWFALVDPARRKMVLQHDGRRVSWAVSMTDARRRVARAHGASQAVLGDEGPTRILRETGRWLERFHPHSAVELDYGGLIQLMTDDEVAMDTSAADVHAIVRALETGDTSEVRERYEALTNFWSPFAARERCN